MFQLNVPSDLTNGQVSTLAMIANMYGDLPFDELDSILEIPLDDELAEIMAKQNQYVLAKMCGVDKDNNVYVLPQYVTYFEEEEEDQIVKEEEIDINIDRFDHNKAMSMGLKSKHLILLDYLVRQHEYCFFKTRLIDNEVCFHVSYDTIIEDMPILRIGKSQLQKIFKSFVDKNILIRHEVREGGSFSYYAFGEGFKSICVN